MIKHFIIKFNQVNMSLCRLPTSLVQALVKRLELPTDHQLVEGDAIHWWFRASHVKGNVVLDGDDTIKQSFCQVLFHARITVLPRRPILALNVEECEDQIDHDFQLTGFSKIPHG